MAGGTAGKRYVVQKTLRLLSSIQPITFTQTFHVDVLRRFEFQMATGTTAFRILDRATLAAASDLAFIEIVSTTEGVRFWFVDAVNPTSASPQSGPKRYLRPEEFTTEQPFAAGSRPAIVLENNTGRDAHVVLHYARYA